MPKEEKLSGKKRLLSCSYPWGGEISSRLLKQFTEQEIETITMEIANLSRVEKELRDEVLEKNLCLLGRPSSMLEGGIDYARELLEKHWDTTRRLS